MNNTTPIFSLHQQNYEPYQRNNHPAERLDRRSPVGARGSRGVVAGVGAGAEDDDHPVPLVGDPDAGVLGVVEEPVVLGLGVVGQHNVGHKAGHACRHHLPVLGHRRIEVAAVEKLGVVGELRLGAGHGVGSGGVGALLALELLC
uniref:Uncharacterized protein n=1 Tax=Aegilops tauschii subsp. strangulata TaxID=200361 RepID=A0A453AXC3_AEGTS